jgi:hypothetical protein
MHLSLLDNSANLFEIAADSGGHATAIVGNALAVTPGGEP